MKQNKPRKSNSSENPQKKDRTIAAAIIGGLFIVIAAIITGYFGLKAARIQAGADPDSNMQEHQTSKFPVETGNNPLTEYIREEIHATLPEPEKQHPQAAYRHNANAKQLLDKIIKLSDREIKNLLDSVFIELNKSFESDNEFGETYYFYGVAYFKLGDYYSMMNDTTRAIDAYNESLRYFIKSEHLYIHHSNVYFDRGKTYYAIAGIYYDTDFEKAKEYYQTAVNDFNKALNNNYNYSENIYFVIGNIHYKMEEYQQARECYTNALKTANDQYKPTKAEIYFNRSNTNFRLGMSCFLREDYEGAVQYYGESISDYSENFSAHFELGKTYSFQKRWEDAVRQFDFILERNPRNFDVATVKDSRRFALSMIK